MSLECELIDYIVPSLSYNVNIQERRTQRKITIENNISIFMLESDDKRGIITINTQAVDDKKEIQYSLEIKGLFNFSEPVLDKNEGEKFLQENGFPQLYAILIKVIDDIQNVTRQSLPSLPKLNELENNEE